MKTPYTRSEATLDEKFARVQERMRSGGHTGTVEVESGVADGGAVFLNGAVVYARYREEVAEEALESLLSCDRSRVRTSSSTPEAVRMFRTYMRYISDNAVLTTEPLDGATVDSYEVEGVIVRGVRSLSAGSWRGETDSSDRSFFPEGKRTKLAPDTGSLRKHVSDRGATGYAAGDGEVYTFRDGELVERRSVRVGRSVRADVGAGAGWVVVDADAYTENEGADNEDGEAADGEKAEGLLSRLF